MSDHDRDLHVERDLDGSRMDADVNDHDGHDEPDEHTGEAIGGAAGAVAGEAAESDEETGAGVGGAGGSVVGGVIGAAVAGPPGALVGTFGAGAGAGAGDKLEEGAKHEDGDADVVVDSDDHDLVR